MNEESDSQVVFCGAQLLFLRWHGATWGVREVLGVVGDAHIRARFQLTVSCRGVILGRISRPGCGPASPVGESTLVRLWGNLRRRTAWVSLSRHLVITVADIINEKRWSYHNLH